MSTRWKLILISAILLVSSVLAVLVSAVLNKSNAPPPSATALNKPLIIAQFNLTDENGQSVTQASYGDNFKLVYFGFTFCPDVCPNQLSVIAEALDLMGSQATTSITPLFITLDPERDNPKTVKAYTDYFHPQLIGLTGTKEQIKQAAKQFKVYFNQVKDETSTAAYTIDHSSIVFLIGRHNNYLKAFTFRDSPQSMSEALRQAIDG